MTLGLQLGIDDEEIQREIAAMRSPNPEPGNYNIPKRFQGTIHPTPEYNAFDKVEKALQYVGDLPFKAWGQGKKNIRSGELNYKELSGK